MDSLESRGNVRMGQWALGDDTPWWQHILIVLSVVGIVGLFVEIVHWLGIEEMFSMNELINMTQGRPLPRPL